jgi:hypothetical protein
MSFCPECGKSPCVCGTQACKKIGELELVRLEYRVNGEKFLLLLPFNLVHQYYELYDSIRLMDIKGNIIEYSSVNNSGVGGKEKNNGKKQ